MGKYTVKLLTKAYRDLDNIYGYIAKSLMAPMTADNLIGEIEETILSLEEFPYRGAERRVGVYANTIDKVGESPLLLDI